MIEPQSDNPNVSWVNPPKPVVSNRRVPTAFVVSEAIRYPTAVATVVDIFERFTKRKSIRNTCSFKTKNSKKII